MPSSATADLSPHWVSSSDRNCRSISAMSPGRSAKARSTSISRKALGPSAAVCSPGSLTIIDSMGCGSACLGMDTRSAAFKSISYPPSPPGGVSARFCAGSSVSGYKPSSDIRLPVGSLLEPSINNQIDRPPRAPTRPMSNLLVTRATMSKWTDERRHYGPQLIDDPIADDKGATTGTDGQLPICDEITKW